jgi:murein DD-endopeptidase MepM/ murein hydrolase activator NlpD
LKSNRNTSRRAFLILPVVLVLGALIVLLVLRMEGQPPLVTLTLDSPALGANQTLPLHAADAKSGLRKVTVSLLKDGQEIALLENTYPSAGVFRGGAVREESMSVSFEPIAKGIKDGKALLRVSVRDYSWRRWGKGNVSDQEYEVLIDTRPPLIDVLSRANYFAQGGAGLVIYKVSEQCRASGVYVGEHFYPGVSGHFDDPLIYLAMVAVDYQLGPGTPVHVSATDLAGNQTRTGMPNLINARRFKKDELPISDSFLDWKMTEFVTQLELAPGVSNLDIFLKVNSDLRRLNDEALARLTARSDPQIYWEGEFLRLPAAAPRAGFADHRTYFYRGRKIDEQTHMGIDLASLERAPVPAANTGKVVFSENLGIYGGTVVIDHGMGLFSMYSHLSQMVVSPGQMVRKGDTIGNTGVSGLAGGDHLHYGMLVHQTWVNPIEWWDAQWIRNNISAKIEAVKKP